MKKRIHFAFLIFRIIFAINIQTAKHKKMNEAYKDIKNWNLITEVFGDDYNKYIFHDGTLKRFDYNEDTLTIVINNDNGGYYDITFKMTGLINIQLDTEIGNDYIHEHEITKDKYYNFLFNFFLNGVSLEVSCINIEVVSVVEAEYFQRGAIMLDEYDPQKGIDNTPMLIRS